MRSFEIANSELDGLSYAEIHKLIVAGAILRGFKGGGVYYVPTNNGLIVQELGATHGKGKGSEETGVLQEAAQEGADERGSRQKIAG